MLTSEPQQTRTTRATRPKGRDWVIEQGRALFVAMLFLDLPIPARKRLCPARDGTFQSVRQERRRNY